MNNAIYSVNQCFTQPYARSTGDSLRTYRGFKKIVPKQMYFQTQDNLALVSFLLSVFPKYISYMLDQLQGYIGNFLVALILSFITQKCLFYRGGTRYAHCAVAKTYHTAHYTIWQSGQQQDFMKHTQQKLDIIKRCVLRGIDQIQTCGSPQSCPKDIST